MKDKKRRCMEIEIGDKITIIDADEGEVEAEVTHMVWKGSGGYRLPDAMEVQWEDNTGETLRGEVDMTEDWEPRNRDDMRFLSQKNRRGEAQHTQAGKQQKQMENKEGKKLQQEYAGEHPDPNHEWNRKPELYDRAKTKGDDGLLEDGYRLNYAQVV